MTARTLLPESQMGPAERLLDLVLGSSAHLWHNRPGLDVNGTWLPAKNQTTKARGKKVAPGLFVPAAVSLYSRLLEIHKLNADLMAHLASYALVETDWRDPRARSFQSVQEPASRAAASMDGKSIRVTTPSGTREIAPDVSVAKGP